MAVDWVPGELLIWGSGTEKAGRADIEAQERVLGGGGGRGGLKEGGTHR